MTSESRSRMAAMMQAAINKATVYRCLAMPETLGEDTAKVSSDTTIRRVGVGVIRMYYLQNEGRGDRTGAFCIELNWLSFSDAALALQNRSGAVQFGPFRQWRQEILANNSCRVGRK
jgi:hypothetical protein